MMGGGTEDAKRKLEEEILENESDAMRCDRYSLEKATRTIFWDTILDYTPHFF